MDIRIFVVSTPCDERNIHVYQKISKHIFLVLGASTLACSKTSARLRVYQVQPAATHATSELAAIAIDDAARRRESQALASIHADK